MLIKEYRIPLPMSVEEYKIAQLYMIQRKSREESQGKQSGIEIVENRPYTDGPGGDGQYTRKIYHIAGHVPQYIKNLIPKSARSLHEEAWNAYPYARTKFSCEFVPKFSLEIESRYEPDAGTQDNIFNLKPEELAVREVVFIDVAVDRVDGEPPDEENPLIYQSEKTGRGPLKESWIEDGDWETVFCAYKLCRVDFPFWGFQTRVERYAHDHGIRKLLVKAHRQAWVWQDSYHGLTIEDIRQLERETQRMLEELYAQQEGGSPPAHAPLVAPQLQNVVKMDSCLSRLSLTISDTESEYFDAQDFEPDFDQRNCFYEGHQKLMATNSADSNRSDDSYPGVGKIEPNSKLLFIVFHGGTLLDVATDTTKMADCQLLQQSLSNVVNTICPTYKNRIEIKLVACPQVCADVVSTLVGVLPTVGLTDRWGEERLDTGYGLNSELNMPFEVIPMLTAQTPKYAEALGAVCREANRVFTAYREEDPTFTHNQVTVIADSVGGLLAYDILTRDEDQSDLSVAGGTRSPTPELHAPPTTPGLSGDTSSRLNFTVDRFFSFGSPIGNLALHKALSGKPVHPKKIHTQFYNLFYASSPGAIRIEPVLDAHLAAFPPVCIPRFNKAPFGLGAGSKYSINSLLEEHKDFLNSPVHAIHPTEVFASTAGQARPISTSSLGLSGVSEWWGNKRLDYALFYPEALRSFPSVVLPSLLHSSYWENYDVAAFVVQQVLGIDELVPSTPAPLITPRSTESDLNSCTALNTEKWLRRRTKLKVNNLNPNHRCFDGIFMEGQDQEITAKFFYGPLDALSLVGERVDISIRENHPSGDWRYLGTQVTQPGGRIHFRIPERLGTGMYPVRCIVRGDMSTAEGFLAVVPPETECVVFSIDGSFTLNKTLMGRDAKIRPGAVEVVRLWQELGFVIIYITARPDLQKESVLEWLGVHNFPHGIVTFSDGISPTDPLKDKTEYLIRLKTECKINVYAAYGSAKDINVYQSAGIQLSNMYIVKPKNPKRKHQVNWIHNQTFTDHMSELRRNAPATKTWTRVPISGDQFRFPSQKRVSRCGTMKRQFSSKSRTSTDCLPSTAEDP